MNFRQIRFGLAIAALATGAVLTALPAEAAKIFFTPAGMQLDIDPINDIATNVGDTLTIETFLDTSGLTSNVGELTYEVLYEELALNNVVQALGSPLALDASSTNTVRTYTGNLAPNTVTSLDVFTFTVLADLNNDGKRDFRAILEDVFNVSGFDITNAFTPDEQRVEVQPVPTPALLPAALGMGVAALRKKRKQETDADLVSEPVEA